MLGEDGQVDLEDLSAAPVGQLEVGHHRPVVGGVVPQVPQHHPLGIVDRLTHRNHPRHRPQPPVRTCTLRVTGHSMPSR